MRGADTGPWREICALPAFWVGLMYDQSALDDAWDMVKDWTAEERQALRDQVPMHGLQTPFRTGTLQDLAKRALEIARTGLNARAALNLHGENETVFLQDLDAMASSGRSNADRLIDLYKGAWDGDISRVYKECTF